jgi:hypothetical protein
MIPTLHAKNIVSLQEKVDRRRCLIAELVPLEAELLAAGAITRPVVKARSVVHGQARYTAVFDNRQDL